MYWNQRRVSDRRRLAVAEATATAARTGAAVAATKVGALVRHHPDLLPLYTRDGRWQHEGEAWTRWCEGFLGGQLWLLADLDAHGHLGADAAAPWRSWAEHYTRLVEDRQHDDQVHDLGFVLAPTWLRAWEVTGDEHARQVVLTGARTMAGRFRPAGRYLPSFLAPGSTFVDIMMNVGLVAVAGLESGDDRLLAVADQHCATTRKHLVRGDGSVAHEGVFDVATGRFLRQRSQQGWRDDSSWARGLAWSLYGFTSMYALTGDRRWLATAELNADHWVERTRGADPVPPNDFDEPDPARRWESSAAACAAGGLMMLATLTPDDRRAVRLQQYAEVTLRRLCEPEFLAHEDRWEGVLKHGSYHEGKGLGVDESVMWGDYFFLETVARVLGSRPTGPASAVTA